MPADRYAPARGWGIIYGEIITGGMLTDTRLRGDGVVFGRGKHLLTNRYAPARGLDPKITLIFSEAGTVPTLIAHSIE